MTRLLALALVFGALTATPGLAPGAAPPARLTAEQQGRLQAARRLQREALAALASGADARAVGLLKDALAVEVEVLGADHPSAGVTLTALVRAARADDHDSAAQAWADLAAVRARRLGPDHWQTRDARREAEQERNFAALLPGQRGRLREARTRTRLMVALEAEGKIPEALREARAAHAACMALLSADHALTLRVQKNVALLLVKDGQAAEAVRAAQSAAERLPAVLGVDNPECATALEVLGLALDGCGKPALALRALTDAVRVRRAAEDRPTAELAAALANLAGLLSRVGRGEEAVRAFGEAREVVLRVRGPKSAEFAQVLDGLAAAWLARGDAGRALALAGQAAQAARAAGGPRHPLVAAALTRSAECHTRLGEVAEAVARLEEASSLLDAALGEVHPSAVEARVRLARAWQVRGEPSRAAELVGEALGRTTRTRAAFRTGYAERLADVGRFALDRGDWVAAREELEEAGAGESPLAAARHGRDLAALARLVGDGPGARKLAGQAVSLVAPYLGEDHPEAGRALAELARAYRQCGDEGRADALFGRALGVMTAALTEGHPEVVALRRQRDVPAPARSGHGAATGGGDDYRRARAAVGERFAELLDGREALTEPERLERLAALRAALGVALTAAPGPGVPAGQQHDLVLKFKAAQGRPAAEGRLRGREPALKGRLEELRDVRAGLTALRADPHAGADLAAWRKRVAGLEARRETLERDLAEVSPALRGVWARLRADSRQVAGALPADSALIDVVEVEAGRDGARLVAFVVAPGSAAVRVDLGPADEVARLVGRWRAAVEGTAGEWVGPGAELRRRVWLPVARHLGRATTVLVAPDGALCGLPLGALPGDEPGTVLLEQRAFVVLAGGHLAVGAAGGDLGHGLMVAGGLAFGEAKAGDGWPVFTPREGARPGKPGYLEAGRVAAEYRRAFPRAAAPAVVSGPDLDREALTLRCAPGKAGPGPRWVHLATPVWCEGVAGSLPRCALALSGANGGRARGLLTASAARELDLDGVEVLTLSGGAVGGGRGAELLALPAALHDAGARAVVSALWPADEAATAVVMEEFARALWGGRGLTKVEALRQAQLRLMKNPALAGSGRGLVGPGAWAGFVLSGEWR